MIPLATEVSRRAVVMDMFTQRIVGFGQNSLTSMVCPSAACYYNADRVHRSLDGATPSQRCGEPPLDYEFATCTPI
jgi:hypothetical protein